MEGIEKDGISYFRLVYIGEGESLQYLKHLFFAEVRSENNTLFPLWNMRKVIKQLQLEDMCLYVEINRLFDFLIPVGGFHTFPWIKMVVFLSSKCYLQTKRMIEGTYGRKIRKYKYSYQITKNKKLVNKFYGEFYLPYIKERYMNTMHLRSLKEIMSSVESGFLLQIFDGDHWVSGAICKLEKNKVIVRAFGLIQEYPYYLRRGALSAVYYFIFKWAEQNSLQIVDLQRSRAHTNDGVYEHKRRWGAKAVKDMWPHTSLWIFIQKKEEVPLSLKKQLVWNGNKFVQLQELTVM